MTFWNRRVSITVFLGTFASSDDPDNKYLVAFGEFNGFVPLGHYYYGIGRINMRLFEGLPGTLANICSFLPSFLPLFFLVNAGPSS